MEKYIFITMNVGGINGAEQYIYNKMNFLKKNGYQVFVFSGRPEKILIDGFREYEGLVNTALRFYPYCLSQKGCEKVLKWILSVVNMRDGDTCIVETSNVISSLWGELVAQRIGCRHLAINMQENHNHAQSMRDFLEFKWKRHELSGIFQGSVGAMLKKTDLEVRPDMVVRAFCNNVVQDCEENFSRQFDPNADYTFGSIGRLEKEYVPVLLQQLTEYFKSHPDKKYNLLLIGGASDKHRLSWIKDAVSSCGNVTLVVTGQIYPIPRQLIQKADIFLSASGSAAISYYEKVPSIRVHHVTSDPVGIIGYDYMLGDIVPPDKRVDRSTIECVNLLVNRSIDISYMENYEQSYNEKMYTEFARHLGFGEEISEMEYYDAYSVRYKSRVYQICRIVCRIFGVKFTYRMLELIRKTVRGTNE